MIEDLMNKIKTEYKEPFDAIVVEGYDGVGKGRILNKLSEYYGITPYRPDYNLWQMFDHRNIDRWKISGFFWDVYSHFNNSSGSMSMLFDRGVISGAVYNDDMTIALHYKEMLRDMRVLHILVTCNAEDYKKFYKARNPEYSESQFLEDCNKYVEYTDRYIEALEMAEVDYIIYVNEYEDDVDNNLCKTCGHYSYGVCRHPHINDFVCGDNKRCELSKDKEVQDRL